MHLHDASARTHSNHTHTHTYARTITIVWQQEDQWRVPFPSQSSWGLACPWVFTSSVKRQLVSTRVAVSCSVVQCIAAHMLPCLAVLCSVLQHTCCCVLQCCAMYCSTHVAVSCNVVQCIAAHMLACIAWSLLKCQCLHILFSFYVLIHKCHLYKCACVYTTRQASYSFAHAHTCTHAPLFLALSLSLSRVSFYPPPTHTQGVFPGSQRDSVERGQLRTNYFLQNSILFQINTRIQDSSPDGPTYKNVDLNIQIYILIRAVGGIGRGNLGDGHIYQVCIYVHTYMYMYMYVFISISIYVHIHIGMCAYIHTWMYTCLHILYTNIHSYLHIYVYMYLYIGLFAGSGEQPG